MRRVNPKKIPKPMRLGQKGVNLVEKIVLDMEFAWYPTGGVEAGIDGRIELIDPQTDAALNLIILVQSKAVGDFEAETETTLEYTCKERDLDYWLRGNAPVIIVVSRPATNEAYWVSIKDYFKDLGTHKSKKIRFDKKLNRFDANCKDALFQLAVPKDAGVYFAPPPKTEHIYSNLLMVSRFGESIYAAKTEFRSATELKAALEKHVEYPSKIWILQDERLYSFHNLTEEPWDKVCDVSTIECISSKDWALTDDPVRSRHFVWLLKEALRDKLGKLGVRYNKKQECFYFKASNDLSPRLYHYRSFQSRTRRMVVTPYINPDRPDKAVYRHNAFSGRFRRFDGVWYLEITPTYYFTTDGKLPWRFYEEWLRGIKRIEKNRAVSGQVIMWARRLSEPIELFEERHPFLGFGELQVFTLEVGIKDDLWLPSEQALLAERQAEVALATMHTAGGGPPEEEEETDNMVGQNEEGEFSDPSEPHQLSFPFV